MPIEKPAEGALAANVAAAFEGFTEAPDGGFVGPEDGDGTGASAPEAAPAAPAPTTASAVAPPEVEPKPDEGAKTETPAGAPATGTVDAPERYFEVDLSGLPAEERVKVIDALKERDDEIGKLLRGKAKDEPAAPAQTAAAEEVQPPPQLSDEDIVKHLGLDPENPFDETAAKVGVPLVRELLSLRETVTQLAEDREADQHLQTWHTTLDTLEKLHGELPLDRTALIEYAAENNLQDPESAFWRVMGPARRQVEEAVKAAEQRIAAAGAPAAPSAAAVSSTRPRTTGATEEAPVEGTNIRDAVKDAGLKVLRDLGIGD